ncbi:hypothetical protein AAMO2058_001281500 [Amorphochlora amoebiformis]
MEYTLRDYIFVHLATNDTKASPLQILEAYAVLMATEFLVGSWASWVFDRRMRRIRTEAFQQHKRDERLQNQSVITRASEYRMNRIRSSDRALHVNISSPRAHPKQDSPLRIHANTPESKQPKQESPVSVTIPTLKEKRSISDSPLSFGIHTPKKPSRPNIKLMRSSTMESYKGFQPSTIRRRSPTYAIDHPILDVNMDMSIKAFIERNRTDRIAIFMGCLFAITVAMRWFERF